MPSRKRRKLKDDSDSESDDDGPDVRMDGNHIFFWCNVTKKTALDLIIKLRKACAAAAAQANEFTHPPVYIHINSNGGDVDAALGVIDTIDALTASGANIVSIVEGSVASAATLISTSVGERRICAHAYMRIHQVSTGLWGKKVDLDDEHTNLTRLELVLTKFYQAKTDMTRKQIRALMGREKDLSPRECKERGLVDTIL